MKTRAPSAGPAHAVVLGASIAGLLAARVLADVYQEVTIVERDNLPVGPVNRRGVPQGKQIHIIQARGLQILEELFPNFSDELRADGVTRWDDGDLSKVHISVAGHETVRSGKVSSSQPIAVAFASRPLLECHVRRHVRAIPHVRFLECHDVVGLTATQDHKRVTGVQVVNRETNCQIKLSADLVVDATGRGSRTPQFLEELGYGRPREDELTVQLAYACQTLRLMSASSEN